MSWKRTRGARSPLEPRFFAKVAEAAGGCWEWAGARNPRGYGQFRDSDRGTVSAHRWSWEFFRGEIPDGLEVDHLCFNRACVNPDHLDLVTRLVNVNRGRKNQNHLATHCTHGHPFDDLNTRINPKNGKRVCRACSRENMRRYRSERGAA